MQGTSPHTIGKDKFKKWHFINLKIIEKYLELQKFIENKIPNQKSWSTSQWIQFFKKNLEGKKAPIFIG